MHALLCVRCFVDIYGSLLVLVVFHRYKHLCGLVGIICLFFCTTYAIIRPVHFRSSWQASILLLWVVVFWFLPLARRTPVTHTHTHTPPNNVVILLFILLLIVVLINSSGYNICKPLYTLAPWEGEAAALISLIGVISSSSFVNHHSICVSACWPHTSRPPSQQPQQQ